MALNRATELEAVNTMLSAVGEPPINSLDAQKNADAAIARNILKEVNREIQTHGWHFNTQRDVSFSPDSNTKEILVGDNVVRIDIDITSVGTSYDERDITQRGNKLFDRKDNTYEFTSDVKATVTYLFDWDELPEPFKNYVTVRSARIFQDRMVGSHSRTSIALWPCSRSSSQIRLTTASLTTTTCTGSSHVLTQSVRGLLNAGQYVST